VPPEPPRIEGEWHAGNERQLAHPEPYGRSAAGAEPGTDLLRGGGADARVVKRAAVSGEDHALPEPDA
jgi:hypothetical protein